MWHRFFWEQGFFGSRDHRHARICCITVSGGFIEDGTASLGTKNFSALKISGRRFLAPSLCGVQDFFMSRDHLQAYICCSNGSGGFSAKDGTAFFGTKKSSPLKISGRSFLAVLVVLLLGLSIWDN